MIVTVQEVAPPLLACTSPACKRQFTQSLHQHQLQQHQRQPVYNPHQCSSTNQLLSYSRLGCNNTRHQSDKPQCIHRVGVCCLTVACQSRGLDHMLRKLCQPAAALPCSAGYGLSSTRRQRQCRKERNLTRPGRIIGRISCMWQPTHSNLQNRYLICNSL